MEIFNIGIPELVFIFLIMLIFLGPEGFSKTARGLARLIRKLVHSPVWNDLVKAQRDIQELPTRLVREAGIEEIQQEMSRLNNQVQGDLNSARQPVQYGGTIAPPEVETGSIEETEIGVTFDYRAVALGSMDEPGSDGPARPGETPRQDEEETENPGQVPG